MIDVTTNFNRYRECIKFLWNNCCHVGDDEEFDWDQFDLFDDICVSLFSLLILRPNGLFDYKKSNSYEQFPNPVSRIHIVPSMEENVPIFINRDIRSGGYWDYSADNVRKSDIDLLFIDLFDFDVQAIRKFEYYRVRIASSKDNASIVGRDALIKVTDAQAYLDPNSNETNETGSE